MAWGKDIYDLVRIAIERPCKGYYLRWYYNGWHYWFFLPGEYSIVTNGEKYRTYGIRKVSMGSGQMTRQQAAAVRTLANTREIYLYTDAGWANIRIEPGSFNIIESEITGEEIEFIAIIGSRGISTSTGFSPVISIPDVPPDDQCELDIAIAGQIWMCKNWDAAYPGSHVYDDDEDNRAELGGLYTYAQVMTPSFVPDGWHVPTVAEWTTLINACGGASVAGGVLKEIGFTHWNAPNTGAVDTHGFAAVGGGFRTTVAYARVYDLGMFWTADEDNTPPLPPNVYANYVRMENDSTVAIFNLIEKNNYMCLRLIKNHYCPACVALAATNLGNSNFTANWTAVTGATGYYLDVSTDPAYGSFVPGYHNLYVGNVLTYDVTGLTPGVTYYYRMRSETAFCTSIYSNSITQAMPGALLISTRGDGSGVAQITLTVSSNITLSLSGTARFYSDVAGTLDESTTWIVTSGAQRSRYVRCPSGTANLSFSDISKLISAGSVYGNISTNSFWGYTGSITNIPSITLTNWNFPNCINIALTHPTIIIWSFDLSDLIPTYENVYFNQTGTVIGSVNDIPASCDRFVLFTTNSIDGDTSDIPAGVISFAVGGTNVITGDLADLPAGLIWMSITGNNTIYGDIADLPATLVFINLQGDNIVNGDIADFKVALTIIAIYGDNTITGDIADLSNLITNFQISGNNTVFGDLVNFPTGITGFFLMGVNTITGDLSGLPVGLVSIQVQGNNTISGDIADVPLVCALFSIQGSNTIADYTGKSWLLSGYQFSVIPVGAGGLTSAEVDQLLIDMDTDCAFTGGKNITLTGTNGAPTAASLAARNSLIAKGVTLLTN